jgi:hypothetical protein
MRSENDAYKNSIYGYDVQLASDSSSELKALCNTIAKLQAIEGYVPAGAMIDVFLLQGIFNYYAEFKAFFDHMDTNFLEEAILMNFAYFNSAKNNVGTRIVCSFHLLFLNKSRSSYKVEGVLFKGLTPNASYVYDSAKVFYIFGKKFNSAVYTSLTNISDVEVSDYSKILILKALTSEPNRKPQQK